MLVITPLFMWSDIQKAYHFVQKKMISKKAVQVRQVPFFENVGLRCIAWNRCISSLEDTLLYHYAMSLFFFFFALKNALS
jgi:hypothetical protein